MQGALCRVLYAGCSMQGALCRVLYAGCSMQGALCRVHEPRHAGNCASQLVKTSAALACHSSPLPA